MRSRLICTALVLLAVSLACGRNSASFGVPDIVVLREAGNRLAESEMKRLQALEEPRKDELIRSPTMNPFTYGTSGIYSRVYREYTGYEVKDIRLKDSLLSPVEYEIAYEFKVFSTPGKNDEFPGAKEIAESEREFSLRRESSLTMTYLTDLEGKVTEQPEDPPFEQFHPREYTRALPKPKEIKPPSKSTEDAATPPPQDGETAAE